MIKHLFQRDLKEVNQDGLEYFRWNANRCFKTTKQNQVSLRELQHLANFGRLTGDFLHEITNPLTTASLHIQMYDTKNDKSLREIDRNLKLMERYVKAARSQLKIQSSRKNFVVRSEIAQSMLLLKPMAKKAGVKLHLPHIDPNLTIQGDAVKFNQIFANLVANAIDAYAGVISETKNIDITIRCRGRFLHLYVHDKGRGIRSDQLPELFKPFYTTKNATGRGLGIGLSLVKRIVEEDFRGYIYATSSVRLGTTFSVKLMMRSRSKII